MKKCCQFFDFNVRQRNCMFLMIKLLVFTIAQSNSLLTQILFHVKI
jgi:hypothetical protein